MKFNKLVSAMSAVTLLAGLAVVPNAMAAGTDLVYAGTPTRSVDGVDGYIEVKYKFNEDLDVMGYSDVSISESYIFEDGIDENIKTLLANPDNPNAVDSKYVSVKMNYIGGRFDEAKNRGNSSPSINVELESGRYMLYYIGGSGSIGNVDAVGTDSEIITISNGQKIANDIYIYPIELVLYDDYAGDIKFVAKDSGSWLPDIYSIKIVDGAAMKTQDDVITASDVIRDSSRTNYNSIVDNMSWNESYNGTARTIFGENFEYSKNVKLTYTDTTDYYYMNVTVPGSYKMYILGATGRPTDVSIYKNGGELLTSYTIKDTVSNSMGSGLTLFEYTTVDFTETGIYKIELSKSTTDSYYTDFIAAAFEKIENEPVLTDPTAEVTAVVTSDKGDGDVASAVKASIIPNDYVVTGLTWAFTDDEKGTGTYETTNINISGSGAVDYVLYINGYLVPSEESVSVAASSKAPVSEFN